MNNKVLLPVFLFPPISWFSVFLNPENEVVLEKFENFPKQTYRNRTIIYGANGKLSLIIPVKHNGKKDLKSIEISLAEDWKSQHWKSIKSAYQNTPYFEFYEDKLKSIFDKKTDSLLDFNLNALQVVLAILKSDKTYKLTDEYVKNPDYESYRDSFSAKQESEIVFPDYYQSFSEKHGFLKDLSIIDLLCNIGPESTTYIKSIKLK